MPSVSTAPTGAAVSPTAAAPMAPAVSALNRAALPLLCGFLLLTGAAGLIYQVAWVRLLGLSLGVTVYAISTVLAAFMGGLAIGSVVGGRFADRTRWPLRAYGCVELGIGLLALATQPAFAALQELYRQLASQADPTQAGLVRGVVAFALLLAPTALMGASLPLAVRGVRRAAEVSADSRAMGVLYALNTTGAIVGSVGAGLVLIGTLGISRTIGLAAALNIGAGLAAIALSVAVREGSTPIERERVADEAVLAAAPEAGDPALPRLARAAFWSFGISGGVSLAYEVVWSRILAILFTTSVYGFVLMLGTVLFGIAVGSAVAGYLVSRHPGARAAGRAFGWVEIGIGLGAVLALAAFGSVYELLLGFRDLPPTNLLARLVRTDLRLMGLLCVLTVLPASLFMGATFPLAARLWAAGAGKLGSRLGGIYAANVAGAIVGSLAAGFLLVPVLGGHASLLALAAINVALGVWLLWAARPETARASGAVPPWAAPALAGLVGGGVLLWGARQPPLHTLLFGQKHPGHEIIWYREGLENTITVARNPEDGIRTIFTNSRGQSNDDPVLTTFYRTLAHLAGLIGPPNPRVLVVGLGSGVTAGTLAQYPGAQVTVAELSDGMIQAAPLFREQNRDVLNLPNARVVNDDGRNFMLRSRQQYDIITADVVHPFDAGSNNLYSVEYFRLVARNLAPNGIMLQWLPPSTQFEHETVMRTFLEVFPNATLWYSGDVIVGSPNPIQLDPASLEGRMRDPAVRASLAAIGLHTPRDLLNHFRGDAQEMRTRTTSAHLLTDDRPVFDYYELLNIPHVPADLGGYSSDANKVLGR